jgi:ubiquinone biosynthesis monooxygenase Coq7
MIEKQHYFLPGDKKESKLVTEAIRVNHSGELGAKVIYQGQILAAKTWHKKDKTFIAELEKLYATEVEHYQYFNDLIKKRAIRPSFFVPLWQRLGFLLGYFSAFFGQKTAMAMTVAIEEVISDHYLEQKEILQNFSEEELQSKITKFLAEEEEHLAIGLDWDVTSLKGYSCNKKVIKFFTKVAIYLAKLF